MDFLLIKIEMTSCPDTIGPKSPALTSPEYLNYRTLLVLNVADIFKIDRESITC